MARTDLSYEELTDYRPAVAEPPDFDTFWENTLAENRVFDLNVQLRPVDTPYRTVEIYDASFSGYAGDRINAWLLRPRYENGPRPAVVEFIGYNGGRDVPGAFLSWASAGYVPIQ
jgi:cephalosporin-C deacetylase